MAGRDPHTYRFRIVIELGPSYDYSRFMLLRWLLRWLVDMRLDCPVPFELRIEPVDDPSG